MSSQLIYILVRAFKVIAEGGLGGISAWPYIESASQFEILFALCIAFCKQK
jgi:hypothetical protein